MREVKLREEEYTFVKDLVSGIRGLSDNMHLMRRERRLLAHGALQHVHLRRQDKQALYHQVGSLFQDRSVGEKQRREAPMAGKNRPGPRRRANSLDSCLSEGLSFKSISSLASETSLDSDTYLRVSEKSKLKSAARGGKIPVINVAAREVRQRMKMSPLYAFVFSDIALITVPLTKRRSNDGKAQNAWELAEDVGICRILSVVDHSGRLGKPCLHFTMTLLSDINEPTGCDSLIEINVVPMDREGIDDGVAADASSTSVFVSLTNDHASRDRQIIQKRWWDAFESCAQSTLRSLSYPVYSGRYLAHGSNGEHDANTRQTVMEILASGLPLPKSPSAQMIEAAAATMGERLKGGDGEREREERGWWALRFQQTLAEMQRDACIKMPVLQMGSSVLSSQSSARKAGPAGRRPLKLGSKK